MLGVLYFMSVHGNNRDIRELGKIGKKIDSSIAHRCGKLLCETMG